MQLTTIGLDIAKSVFQADLLDVQGRAAQRKLRRDEMLDYFAKLPPSLIGLEACGGAHYWARELRKLGHTVRLMPPAYVKPYVRRGKSDAIDARACREAVGRPDMRFVPVKTPEQQAMRALHKTRSLMIRQRTMLINALRAHLAEHGLVSAKGDAGREKLVRILAEKRAELPALLSTAADALIAQIDALYDAVDGIDRTLTIEARKDPLAKRLMTIPGVGPIIATAIVASVPDITLFPEARDFAAWLGLTPSLHGSGGKVTLGAISKKGDRYLRSLMIVGATALLAHPQGLAPAHRAWLDKKRAEKSSARLVTVAMANKLARVVWVLMKKGSVYDRRLGAQQTSEATTALAGAA